MRVIAVQAMYDHMLWAKFDNGGEKVFDCKPMLGLEQFRALEDPAVFEAVAAVDGSASWLDGSALIHASFLWDNGR